MAKLIVGPFVAVLSLAAPVRAHHALPAHYVPEEMVSITGVVDEFRYRNPHAVIFLSVQDEQGAEELWTVEWAGSSALRRRGVLPETIAAGDRVTLKGHPARDGARAMALNTISFADGRASIGPPDRSGGRNADRDRGDGADRDR